MQKTFIKGHVNKHYDEMPKVTKHARLIDGLLVYVGIGMKNKGKHYLKDVVDNLWNPPKGKVRPRTKKEQREFELHNNFL